MPQLLENTRPGTCLIVRKPPCFRPGEIHGAPRAAISLAISRSPFAPLQEKLWNSPQARKEISTKPKQLGFWNHALGRHFNEVGPQSAWGFGSIVKFNRGGS